jgi:hypothetical protein
MQDKSIKKESLFKKAIKNRAEDKSKVKVGLN